MGNVLRPTGVMICVSISICLCLIGQSEEHFRTQPIVLTASRNFIQTLSPPTSNQCRPWGSLRCLVKNPDGAVPSRAITSLSASEATYSHGQLSSRTTSPGHVCLEYEYAE